MVWFIVGRNDEGNSFEESIFRQIANNLATLDRQIVSKNLAISFRRTKSDDLAIKEAKLLAIKMMLSNAGEVMVMSSKERGYMSCTVLCLLKTYLKPLIR